MTTEKVLILAPAPILGGGLKVRFERWGFALAELVISLPQALESVGRQPPSLVLIDGELPEDCLVAAQQLQAGGGLVPLLLLCPAGWLTPRRK